MPSRCLYAMCSPPMLVHTSVCISCLTAFAFAYISFLDFKIHENRCLSVFLTVSPFQTQETIAALFTIASTRPMTDEWRKNMWYTNIYNGLRKGRGTRDQIANIPWITEKAREFQKNICFCSLATLKPSTVWITTNYRKFLKRWEYQTTLTYLLRNLYAGH